MSRPAGGSRRWRSGTYVPRRRLAGRLRDGLSAGSVLLVAGAGSGKTTALELALDGETGQTAWIGCDRRDRDPGVLLVRLVGAVSDAAPGAGEVLAERLAAAQERVDPLDAARELLDELARLLVEPVVLVLDDAERLDGAAASLALLSKLIRAESAALRLAIVSRTALDLRVAKPRAAGRLADFGAADLAFDAEECAALLRARDGIDPSAAEVGAVMEATEGWPLGIALMAAETGVPSPVAAGPSPSLTSIPDLRAYLAEELVDLLDPDLRAAIVDSSVVRVVTPTVRRALDLPADFGERIERAGALVRHLDGGEAFAYHPLLREFLAERLREERDEAERERLHAAAAPAVAADGDRIGAIEHWLAARDWVGAVAAICAAGPALISTSQDLVRDWLERLPPEERRRPAMRSLEGQLEWLAGDSARAAPALRDAVDGFAREPPDPLGEWQVRTMLIDALWGEADIDGVQEVVAPWDDVDAASDGGMAAVAAMFAATVLVTSGRIEEGERLAVAARERGEARLLAPSEAVFQVGVEVPAGRFDGACRALRRSAAELERSDPLQHRHHVLAALAVVLADRGHPDEALRAWMLIAESARGGAAPRLADAAQGWRALLLAQAGRLEEAERALATYKAVESGSRGFVVALAPATVASLRGDADQTLAWAEQAFTIVAPGAVLFRYWVGADLIAPLAEVGRRGRAHEILADTLSLVDSHYPGSRGAFFRARLLALRAWLRAGEGDDVASRADLIDAWEEAGPALPDLLRREWRRLEPLVADALEDGELEPRRAIEAIALAFPGGLQLVPFLDHPVAAVRHAALEPAVASAAPPALESLRRLRDDPDQEIAAAAVRTAARLASSPPPLRLAVLGGLSVWSGAWHTGEGDWGRPVDARLVRLLIVREGRPVPEEVIVEALWPQLGPSGGRRSLQVAISRARRVLDPPGAADSRIEGRDRAYRLHLGERDTLDADEFAAAAAQALAEHGENRGPLLERARSLWTGEPLPEESYADWATAFRERLLDRYTAILTALVEVREGVGDVAEVARELVALDPLNEGAHRALIISYSRDGRRGHALRQYLECRRALVEELGIEPSEETARLQARILAGRPI